VLRKSPEDFLVEELSAPFDNDGPYLVCRLTKRNWELQRLVKEIARLFGISHRRISWAGTKDKHAVTTQLIAIYNIEPEQIRCINLRDVSLEAVGRSTAPLSLGMLQGNLFSLWIRDCYQEELEARVETCVHTAHAGILNYYGIQRFGARRPVTHQVGQRILKGDYEGAILTYVGRAFPDEPEETRVARQEFWDTRDPKAALRNFPLYLSYERALLHHLTGAPNEYREALRNLPPKLLSMFVSAFQSFLFNSALSARCREEQSLQQPLEGDLLVFSDTKTDQVTSPLLPAARLQVDRGRAKLALFIPGSRQEDWRRASHRVQEILLEHELTPAHFMAAQDFVGTAFQGFHRPIRLTTDIISQTEGTNVHLRFILPPGQYATTVCRECMKTDPLSLV
jgi:tRNA pseudouridine13 synthase